MCIMGGPQGGGQQGQIANAIAAYQKGGNPVADAHGHGQASAHLQKQATTLTPGAMAAGLQGKGR